MAEGLAMPLWFIENYYSSEGWKIQKSELDRRDQMRVNQFQRLENLQIGLKNLHGAMKSIR